MSALSSLSNKILKSNIEAMPATSCFEDTDIKHIELGAGCGNFGKQFFPPCYLTDANKALLEQCQPCSLDCICEAQNIPCEKNRFSKVLICNPFGYGFYTAEQTKQLLDELVRVLESEGKIIVLGNQTNKYFKPSKLEKQIKSYESQTQDTELSVEVEDLNDKIEQLYPNYSFFQCDGKTPAKVTHQAIITLRKTSL
ncbi:MAG: class I SAM-dependent methyltransferase [Bernardetiaceae bacterium]|nr:class I SAM-dependent methyltransferase [Bernardetiaceae bacterium]